MHLLTIPISLLVPFLHILLVEAIDSTDPYIEQTLPFPHRQLQQTPSIIVTIVTDLSTDNVSDNTAKVKDQAQAAPSASPTTSPTTAPDNHESIGEDVKEKVKTIPSSPTNPTQVSTTSTPVPLPSVAETAPPSPTIPVLNSTTTPVPTTTTPVPTTTTPVYTTQTPVSTTSTPVPLPSVANETVEKVSRKKPDKSRLNFLDVLFVAVPLTILFIFWKMRRNHTRAQSKVPLHETTPMNEQTTTRCAPQLMISPVNELEDLGSPHVKPQGKLFRLKPQGKPFRLKPQGTPLHPIDKSSKRTRNRRYLAIRVYSDKVLRRQTHSQRHHIEENISIESTESELFPRSPKRISAPEEDKNSYFDPYHFLNGKKLLVSPEASSVMSQLSSCETMTPDDQAIASLCCGFDSEVFEL